MEVNYRIVYEQHVISEDIEKLSKTTKERVKVAIEEKLTTRPEVFGKPLRESLRGYRRLRVGDYRVVFRIEDKKVKIFAICHRSRVYDMADKRI